MLLPRLALNHLRFRKVRTILTIAAIALSVSLVVAVTTGYRSVLSMAPRVQDVDLGSADAQITRRDESRTEVPYSVVAELKADPRVKSATGRLETESRLQDPEDPTSVPSTQTATGAVKMRRYAHVIGIHRPDDDRISQLTLTEGHWFNSAAGNVAVIDTNIADRQKVSVGGTITLPGIAGDLNLKVVGIVRKPGIMAGIMHTMYGPLETVQKLVAPVAAPSLTRIQIDVKPGVDLQKFSEDWTARLEAIDPSLRIRLARESRKQLDDNLESVHLLSMLGGAVSMLAATFIVFSALSMGVAERQRTLAMMRAIGAVRSQIGWLVMIEGMLLAGIGVAVGVPAGWAWVKILAFSFRHRAPIFFANGVHLDPAGVIMATATAGRCCAAFTREFFAGVVGDAGLTPLEAMSPLSKPGTAIVDSDRYRGFAAHLRRPDRHLRLPGRANSSSTAISCSASPPSCSAFSCSRHRLSSPPRPLPGRSSRRCSTRASSCSASNYRVASGAPRARALRSWLACPFSLSVQIQGRTPCSVDGRSPTNSSDIFIYRPIGPLSLSDTAKIESVPGIKKGELMPAPWSVLHRQN